MTGSSPGTAGQLGEKRDPRMRLPRALEFNAIAEPAASTGEYELVTTISWPDGMFTDDDTAHHRRHTSARP